MCGRINVSDNEGVRLLLAMLGMEVWPKRDPRFNVAPTQSLDVVVWDDHVRQQSMQWGLVPPWAKPGQFSKPLINARSETIREKPSFKRLISSHRTIIPITGFYEWQREGGAKLPYYITAADQSALLLAGIFQPANGSKLGEPAQCSVVTIESNEAMAKVHHRMPVLLTPENALRWIQSGDSEEIDALMQMASNDALHFKKVGDYVNSSRNQGPACIEDRFVDDLFG